MNPIIEKAKKLNEAGLNGRHKNFSGERLVSFMNLVGAAKGTYGTFKLETLGFFGYCAVPSGDLAKFSAACAQLLGQSPQPGNESVENGETSLKVLLS